MPEHGPFSSEREALATRAAALIRAAFDANPGPGASFPAALKVMTDACEETGVVLGDYDLRLLRWLSEWETANAVSFAAMIRRAFEAGKAAGPDGAVTEWGVRYTDPDSSVREVPSANEVQARHWAAPDLDPWGPQVETALIQRQVGPWTPADETATRDETEEGNG